MKKPAKRNLIFLLTAIILILGLLYYRFGYTGYERMCYYFNHHEKDLEELVSYISANSACDNGKFTLTEDLFIEKIKEKLNIKSIYSSCDGTHYRIYIDVQIANHIPYAVFIYNSRTSGMEYITKDHIEYKKIKKHWDVEFQEEDFFF